MVEITEVRAHSRAEKQGILKDDILVSINGHEICDVLDYRFYLAEKNIELLLKRNGEEYRANIRKGEYDDIGLEFATPLMDKKHTCENKCIFCFIDQNPKGMRKSIYFKDDDSRLSFLHGNYITLTNLKMADIQRIINMHISPVNVSVHTMNKELRVKMMKNKNAGRVLDYLPKLSAGGIEINAQLVLCPDVNDGAELEYSLKELYKLPTLNSVAAVPVGLTKHREGLCPLSPFNKESAKRVIETINRFGEKAKKEKGVRTFYASDEFYLKAEVPIPKDSYYEDYPQIENGVGMLRDHKEGFDFALDEAIKGNRKYQGRKKSIATGVAAYPHILSLVNKFKNAYPDALINVYEIKNHFFGESVTVSGLLTGGDIASQVTDGGEIILLPENVLKQDEDIFLDNMTLEELKEKLGVKDAFTVGDGEAFLESLFI